MSYLKQKKIAAPSAPAATKATTYIDLNGVVHVLDENSIDTVVSGRGWFNWLSNAGFWYAQRQTPGTLTTYSSLAGRAFTADRWAVTNENASVQYQRTDTSLAPEVGLQNRYYGNYTKITSTGKLAISQAILDDDTCNLRGRTVRVQVALKSLVAASATWRVGLIQLTSAGTADTLPATFISAFNAAGTDPTLGTNLAYIAPKAGTTPDNATINGNALDCTVTTAWQQFGGLFDVPTNCKNLIVMVWSNGQVVATNGVAISQVSLTDGYEVQEWSPQDQEEEFQRVQRFLVKTFAIDTAPAQNVGINTGNIDAIAGKAAATALGAQLSWRFPQRLWTATPTVTTYNPQAANAQVRDVGAAADCSVTATVVTTVSLRVTATGAAGTAVGNQVSVHAFVDGDF